MDMNTSRTGNTNNSPNQAATHDLSQNWIRRGQQGLGDTSLTGQQVYEQTHALQTLLKDKGTYRDSLDGKYGSNTRDALNGFIRSERRAGRYPVAGMPDNQENRVRYAMERLDPNFQAAEGSAVDMSDILDTPSPQRSTQVPVSTDVADVLTPDATRPQPAPTLPEISTKTAALSQMGERINDAESTSVASHFRGLETYESQALRWFHQSFMPQLSSAGYTQSDINEAMRANGGSLPDSYPIHVQGLVNQYQAIINEPNPESMSTSQLMAEMQHQRRYIALDRPSPFSDNMRRDRLQALAGQLEERIESEQLSGAALYTAAGEAGLALQALGLELLQRASDPEKSPSEKRELVAQADTFLTRARTMREACARGFDTEGAFEGASGIQRGTAYAWDNHPHSFYHDLLSSTETAIQEYKTRILAD